MVASISQTPNPRIQNQIPTNPNKTRPPLEKKPKSREVTSRYLIATPSRSAPNTPIPLRSNSVEKRRNATPELSQATKLLIRENSSKFEKPENGSKRSLNVSFGGEKVKIGEKTNVLESMTRSENFGEKTKIGEKLKDLDSMRRKEKDEIFGGKMNVLGEKMGDLKGFGEKGKIFECIRSKEKDENFAEKFKIGEKVKDLNFVREKVKELSFVGEKVKDLSFVGEKVRDLNFVGEKVKDLSFVGEKVREMKVMGESMRSLTVSFGGEIGREKIKGRKERDENIRPRRGFTRSVECTPENRGNGVTGSGNGNVARALQMNSSVDDSSIVSGTTATSDLVSSDSESVTSRRPRAIAVPARFWKETTNRIRRLPEQNSARKSFSDSPASSPPGVPGGKGSCSPTRASVRPASPSRVPLSPSRGKLSPSRVRTGFGSMMSDSYSHTPSVHSFATIARQGKVGENKMADMHELRMLQNRQLQWQFANARAAAAMKVQKVMAEKSLFTACSNTSELRQSVESKRMELQQLRQQLKLYSILKDQMTYLDNLDLLDGDYSSSLASAVESLVASTLRLPLVGGAKANVQEVEDTISSAVDMMQGIRSSLSGLLEKVVETNSLASELASVSSIERASLDQCRDLLSSLTDKQVMDCCLRAQILQLSHIGPCQGRF